MRFVKMVENKTIRTGMTDRVRAACKALDANGPFSRRDVVWHVDPNDGREELSARRAFQGIYGRGELIRLGRGKYRHIDGRAPTADVKCKIYRAMHIKGAFCAADIKKLTDADKSYISAVIRKLAKVGDLELIGKSGKDKIYQVKWTNRFYLEYVK